MADAVFVPDGPDRFLPTPLAGSPWGRGVLHGGPPAGLLARAIERAAAAPELMVCRLTVDLFKPVPAAPLTVETRTLRTGRRIQSIEAILRADGEDVSRATGLLLLPSEAPLPERAQISLPRPPGPDGIETTSLMGPLSPDPNNRLQGFHTTIEVRRILGSSGGGPSSAWIRIPVPFIAGEETTPLVRVAAISDFGNGLSGIRTSDPGLGFINADITLYLHRYPVGEWIGLEAVSGAQPHGVGLITTAMHDATGPIGWSAEALLANRRSPAPAK